MKFGNNDIRDICKRTEAISMYCIYFYNDDDDEFRFNDTSTHKGHLHQNGTLIWFGI